MTTNNGCSLTPQQGHEATSLFFTKAPGEDYYKVYARYQNNPAWVPIHIAQEAKPDLQQVRDQDRNISMNSGSYEDAHFYLRSADGNNMTAAFFTNADGAAIQAGNADGFKDLNLQPEGGTLHYGSEEVATKDWVNALENVSYKELIPTGADLNNYTKTGLYLQNSDAHAAAGTHYPEPRAGMLEVQNGRDGEMIFQRYTTWAGAGTNVWKRMCYIGTWYAWERLATASDIQGVIKEGYIGGDLNTNPMNSTLYNYPNSPNNPSGDGVITLNFGPTTIGSGIGGVQFAVGYNSNDNFWFRPNYNTGNWATEWHRVASREWVDGKFSNAPYSGQIVKSSGPAGAHTVKALYDYYATSTPADYSDNLNGVGGVITELRGNVNVGLPASWSGISMVQTIPQYKTGSGGGGVHQIAYPDGGSGPKYRFGFGGTSTWGPWREFALTGGDNFINNQNSNWENGNFKILGTGGALRFVASDDNGYSRVCVGSVGAGNVNSITLGGTAAGSSLAIMGAYGLWGTYFGVNETTGDGWLQQGRTDSNPYAYNFIMQAAGGNVGIGGVPTEKLHVVGSIRQTAVTSSMLKADANGKLVAATPGTDFASIRRGTHTIIGDGTTTSFSIPHGLGTTPGSVSMTPKSTVANKIWFDCSGHVPGMDASDITVNFHAPPGNGVSCEYWWTVYE